MVGGWGRVVKIQAVQTIRSCGESWLSTCCSDKLHKKTTVQILIICFCFPLEYKVKCDTVSQFLPMSVEFWFFFCLSRLNGQDVSNRLTPFSLFLYFCDFIWVYCCRNNICVKKFKMRISLEMLHKNGMSHLTEYLNPKQFLQHVSCPRTFLYRRHSNYHLF